MVGMGTHDVGNVPAGVYILQISPPPGGGENNSRVAGGGKLNNCLGGIFFLLSLLVILFALHNYVDLTILLIFPL